MTELKVLYPDVPLDEISASEGGTYATAILLESNMSLLGPNTLLCIAGGDGTINAVVQALLKHPGLSSRVRQTPLLPLWGGNANDLAWALNGSVKKGVLRKVLQYGKVVPIRPICFTLRGALQDDRLAVTTASFGATALVAQRINDASHRQGRYYRRLIFRLIHEGATAWRTVIDAPVSRVQEQGKSIGLYERTLIHGPRMAKHYYIPVRYTDDYFYMDTLAHKIPFITPTLLTFSFRRRARPAMFHDSVAFTAEDPLWAQFDGEILYLPAGTQVEARLNPEPFYMLSTRPTI